MSVFSVLISSGTLIESFQPIIICFQALLENRKEDESE